MKTTTVAVGIDYSPASVNALRWGHALARSFEARLVVVHAWTMPLIARAPDLVSYLPTHDFMQSQSEELMEKALAEAAADPDETSVVEGDPTSVLTEYSSKDTLVVIGRTGRGFRSALSTLADGLLGSTARRTLQQASGPVAVVPSSWASTEVQRVLVGLDDSPAAQRALAWAVENVSEADIEAVRFAIPWAGDPLMPVDGSFAPAFIAIAERELRSTINKTVSRRDAHVTARAEAGGASWGLSREPNKDLVVVGHRDRPYLAQRVLGSVAEHTVRHAKTPTVVVPEVATWD